MVEYANWNDPKRIAVVLPLKTILTAGTAAGVAVDLLLFPLDTLKTRLQSQLGLRASGNLHNLWKGLSSVLIGSAPSAAAFFTSYEFVKRSLYGYNENAQNSHSVNIGAALFGETCACVIRVPTEVVKQRMQIGRYTSSRAGAAHVWRNQGFLGFYRGFGSTIVREIPFSCIQFPLYEYLNERYVKSNPNNSSPLISQTLIGAASGAFAAFLTTPFDVLRTRVILAQTQRSMFEHARALLKEEGLFSFFKGAVPRTSWVALGGGIFFGVFETVKVRIQER